MRSGVRGMSHKLSLSVSQCTRPCNARVPVEEEWASFFLTISCGSEQPARLPAQHRQQQPRRVAPWSGEPCSECSMTRRRCPRQSKPSLVETSRCSKVARRTCCSASSLATCRPSPREGMKVACFGNGCFWGPEMRFWKVPGVYSTAVGYCGGLTPNPTCAPLRVRQT